VRVLVAEDDPVSRRLLRTALVKWGYEVIAVEDGANAWQVLREDDGPRLALLDWMMPEIDGVELCRRVREVLDTGDRYTYILLLTARATKEDIVTGMKAGADDYIIKPFHPHELQVRIRAGARIIELQSELVAARDQLQIQATHDALTGLWNRGAIIERLEHEISRAGREARPLAIAMIDIDHFKKVNDAHGHQAGDVVLTEMAGRLSGLLRPYDALGRYGGEEFLAVLPACNPHDAVGLAERLRQAVASKDFSAGRKSIPVTISIGVSHVADANGADPAELVRLADDALYRAKAAGRNRVELAGEAVPVSRGAS